MPRKRGRLASPVLVDTSAFVALLSANDAHHADAHMWFEHATTAGARLLTTNLIVAEIHRLTLFRVGAVAAKAVLDRLDESTALEVIFADDRHHHAAVGWLGRLPDQTITYTDAVSFAAMRRARCRHVLTLDHDFSVAGFVRWQDTL